MNWSKMKNIMIILLVITNVFLLTDIFFIKYQGGKITPDVRQSFVNILNKNGISIQPEQLPRRYEIRPLITAESYDIDFLSETFIGERVKYITQGQSIIAPGDDKKLTVTGDLIEYTTLKESAESSGADIIKALRRIKLFQKGAYYDKDSGMVKIKAGNICLNGAYLDVSLDPEGSIARLKGVWPRLTASGTRQMSVIGAAASMCEILPQGSDIKTVEKAFFLQYENNEYYVKPGWYVYDRGRKYEIFM